jgi:hypothetical protein
MPCAEWPARYRERPQGSVSKLRTFRDGFRILMLISLFERRAPALLLRPRGLLDRSHRHRAWAAADRHPSRNRPRPTVPDRHPRRRAHHLAALFVFTGIILDVATKTRREMKRLAYSSPPRY